MVNTLSSQQLEARIAHIAAVVKRAVSKTQPDLIVLENHAFNSRGRAGTALHELHGVVKQALFQSESPFYLLPPISIKAFAGNAKASKEEMIERALEFWPELATLKVKKKDDLADAMFAAKWGFDHYADCVTFDDD